MLFKKKKNSIITTIPIVKKAIGVVVLVWLTLSKEENTRNFLLGYN